jgi:hypothetical protein
MCEGSVTDTLVTEYQKPAPGGISREECAAKLYEFSQALEVLSLKIGRGELAGVAGNDAIVHIGVDITDLAQLEPELKTDES